MREKMLILLVVLTVSSIAVAAVNVPNGVVGLWRFDHDYPWQTATIGNDLTGAVANDTFTGPWTRIGTEANPDLYSDGDIVQMGSWGYYLTVDHDIAANGGGSMVNEYTIAMDYRQTQDGGYNSLLQTDPDPHTTDGDLFIKKIDTEQFAIGVGATGYSSATFNALTWHRIVLSVDNGNFFRVYIDGTLYLDGTPQAIDGRFALGETFHLFADESWEDLWGLVGTVAIWDRALSTEEIAPMGGWIGGAAEPTPLVFIPEPATIAMLGLGGFGLLRRRK